MGGWAATEPPSPGAWASLGAEAAGVPLTGPSWGRIRSSGDRVSPASLAVAATWASLCSPINAARTPTNKNKSVSDYSLCIQVPACYEQGMFINFQL